MLDEQPVATGPQPKTGEDRILTVPNLISLVRLATIPVFLYLLFGRQERFAAALLLGALGATDWIDGYVARHFDQVSSLGKILDPVADRLLLGVGIIAILVDGSVPLAVAWAAIARELVVSAAVLALAAIGAARIDVTWVGKAGTFCNMVAFPFFLAGNSDVSWHRTAHWLGWTFAVPAFLLSWYAAATYLPIARRAIRDGRQAAVKEAP